MKLLVFGATGQVGRELARLRPDATCLSRTDVDLTDRRRLRRGDPSPPTPTR